MVVLPKIISPIDKLKKIDSGDRRKRRILLLFPHFTLPGGALNYTLELARLLRSPDADVGILTMHIDRKRFVFPSYIEVISLDGPVTSSMWFWLLYPWWQYKVHRAISMWKPDVIVPQVFPANWWSWLYKLFCRKSKIVWMCQEPSAFIHSKHWIGALRPWWKRLLARIGQPVFAYIDVFLSTMTDKIFVNSQFSSILVEKTYGRKIDGIAYPAIDFSVFRPVGEEKKRELITVAKLTKFKRIDFLLNVFAVVLLKYPELKYHIVGNGEELDYLKSLATELGVDSQVFFYPNLGNDKLVDLLSQSMVFLHGAVEEPFGMAPLEAIACGTPVIAHNSGGPSEFVNMSCGRLVNGQSEEEWVECIESFLKYLETNPLFFKTVVNAVEHFSWERTLLPILEGIKDISAAD